MKRSRRRPKAPELPRLPDLEELQRAGERYGYDFKQASQILEAMDFLRREAVKTGIPEMMTMVDVTFRFLLTAYYCILRREMKELSPDYEGLQ